MENTAMSSCICGDIRIDCPINVQGIPHRELMKNLSIMQNPPIKSKNSKSNKNLEFKININVYILWQRIISYRGNL
jgi:hypothetical protein